MQYSIKNMEENIKTINDLLKKGEPDNISKDASTGYVGYKPQSVIDAMNEVLFAKWGFTEISCETIKDPQGAEYLIVAQCEVWIKDIEFKPRAYGQARITRKDIGDAKKGAQTDAIKKALSYFSIGNRAYLGELQGSDQVIEKSKTVDNYPTGQTNTLGVCEKCGAPKIKYKSGKIGCSKYCWNKK
jgi:hypothetical protein